MNTLINTSSVAQSVIGADFRAPTQNVELTTSTVSAEVNKVRSVNEVQPSVAEVDDALNVVNKAAVFEQRSLSFMMDEASGRSIIKVIDRSTEQLIRQIPSEELLKVAQDIKRLQEEMGQSIGFLVDRQV
ncbi:flagellar protein FlaG [Alishewanella longhuensis]